MGVTLVASSPRLHRCRLVALLVVMHCYDSLGGQGEEVKHDMRAGVLVSGNNLVLQMVRRVSAGNCTCAATNTLTTTASNSVVLDIKCFWTSSNTQRSQRYQC